MSHEKGLAFAPSLEVNGSLPLAANSASPKSATPRVNRTMSVHLGWREPESGRAGGT